MLTVLSSRQNKREAILAIGYTNNFEENKVFCDCLKRGVGLKKGGRKRGVQKGTKRTK